MRAHVPRGLSPEVKYVLEEFIKLVPQKAALADWKKVIKFG